MIGHDVVGGGSGRPQGHTVWFNYPGQQVLAAPEQLRWATEDRKYCDLGRWNDIGVATSEECSLEGGCKGYLVLHADQLLLIHCKGWTPDSVAHWLDRCEK